MEMYRALAPCTVDGEDLSWCLEDGLTWSQSTLNTLWCWECSYLMLIGGFWWNKDKPSPQSARRTGSCRHRSTPTLTLGVDARTTNTSPDITPCVWSPSPAPGRKGCSSCAASWAMVGCASYLSSQLVSLKEQELYPSISHIVPNWEFFTMFILAESDAGICSVPWQDRRGSFCRQ